MKATKHPLIVALALALAAAIVTSPVFAHAATAVPLQPIAWSSLSAEQQKVLTNFVDRWDALPPARQQALARGSGRWVAMSPDQRQEAQQRFRQWRALPPE
ncbi:MAG: DUF3106 domain-containing protein, partial [Steroidobacteraceae bacterium]